MATLRCQKCKQSHPVASAITMIKLNAPRRLPSMRSPNRVTSHQQKRKIEVRYDPEHSERPV